MEFALVGNIKEKVGYHQGIYTRSYQIARAAYDAKIRNWSITFANNIFSVKNSDNVTHDVFYNNYIANCSCHSFVENESGTCMHIEAVKMIAANVRLPSVSPILFLNDTFQLQTKGVGPGVFETPSVKTFNIIKQSKNISFNTITPDSVDVFTAEGISLFDFQLESIQLMLRNIRSVLVLRMGLGKTLCALACVRILNLKKILIVAPNSLKYQWEREIKRFGLGSSIVISKRADISNYNNQRFLILSYEMLNSNKSLLDHKYDVLIADEIQKIKNRESETWKSVSQIKSDFVFALSGTPIQNNITDLLSLIDFLNPYELKPEWKFYEQYCDCTRARIFGIKPSMVDQLKRKISRYIINPKIDYSKFKLPQKNERHIKTNLSPEQLNIHDSYFEAAKILIAKSINHPLTFGEKLALNGLLTKARVAATDARLVNPQAAKSEKFVKIEECIQSIVLEGRKVVVYSEWIRTLDLLHSFLDEKKINYVDFNGSLSAKKRNDAFIKFQEDPSVMVFLSTDTGGLGIDGLQFVSNDVIHVEKIWNPAKIEQRNGRLVRALQKKDVVNIYSFESDAGIEIMIGENHARKHSVIAEMLR